MPLTVKRHKKRKVTRSTNKKRIRRKLTKIPNVKSKEISEVWDNRKSAKKNLSDMGLSYDPNFTVRRSIKCDNKQIKNSKSVKSEIAKLLEKKAKTPRMTKLKFPNAQAMYYTYLIKKYADDYKAMAKDPKNIYQETWKQIRKRILQFKKLEQYKKFMQI